MNYSPKLRLIMLEIKAILEREDIAGYVILHEPQMSEYLLHINPSWSAMKLEEGGLRVRCKLEDFNGDKEKRDKVAGDTANLIVHLGDVTRETSAIFTKLKSMLNEQGWNIEEEGGEGLIPRRDN